MILRKLIPESSPKYIRITALIFFIIFEVVGLGLSLQALWVSFISFLLHAFYFLVLGCGAALAIIHFWAFMTRIARKHTFQKMAAFYAQKGICVEMADALKAIMPFPTPRDRVLRVFLLVMCEHYSEAETEIININEPSLPRRDFAMLATAKLRLYFMTYKLEKAERLLHNFGEQLDRTYDMQLDLFADYRAYADDAYEYFALASVYAQLIRQPEAAAEYRRRAVFQSSNRSEPEMQCYTQLLELNALYAAGKTQEAHALEQQLYMLPETFSPPMTQAQKDDFRRAVEQARIFSAHTSLSEDSLFAERKLPDQGDSPELSGLSLF